MRTWLVAFHLLPQTHCAARRWTDSKWSFWNMCIANKIWLAIDACVRPQRTDRVGRCLKTVFDTADYEWPCIFHYKLELFVILLCIEKAIDIICIIPQIIWQLILFNTINLPIKWTPAKLIVEYNVYIAIILL